MSSRRPCPIATVAAKLAAATTLEGYDFELLQSTRAADRIRTAYGLEPAIAAELVSNERRRRSRESARAARQLEQAPQ